MLDKYGLILGCGTCSVLNFATMGLYLQQMSIDINGMRKYQWTRFESYVSTFVEVESIGIRDLKHRQFK